MSKLAKILSATQGHRVALIEPTPVVFSAQEIKEVNLDSYAYTIGAEFKVRAQCYKKQLPMVLVSAKRKIIENVFGEFRAPIYEIYMKLFDRDFEGALEALRALNDQMYGDEA